jgi:AcrR family transcriptional regulator
MAATSRPPHGSGREAILKAVVEVVADAGLRGLTFRAVGARAGVNNTLIAHYFGNRESLIEAALEWTVDRSISASGFEGFATSPEGFFTMLLESLTEDVELQAFQYEMILEARRKPELGGAIRRLYDQYEEALDDSLQRAGIVGIDAATRRALFGGLDGLVLQRVSGTITVEEFREALERVLDFARLAVRQAGVEGVTGA